MIIHRGCLASNSQDKKCPILVIFLLITEAQYYYDCEPVLTVPCLLAGPLQLSGTTLLSGSFLLSDAQLTSGNITLSKLSHFLKDFSITQPCRFLGILKNSTNIQPRSYSRISSTCFVLSSKAVLQIPHAAAKLIRNCFLMPHSTSLCILIFLSISFSAK